MTNQDNPILREILARAVELPPEQRSAFLDGACSGNSDLRAEIESLLSSLKRDGQFLRDPTMEHGAFPSTTVDGGSPGTLIEGPDGRIGRYKLLQLIGEGGFGSVFMAEQEHPVRRRVALKIIKLGMDTKQVIARFEAERQALAMMDHPNIAKVLDAGTTETGRPYFVMDLVKGVPITEYCDTQNLSTRERLELFICVCQAVQHAHQKGIIHRDIKPSNVLVTLADGKPLPKIIDFGIAKATSARLTEQTYFTEFRQFIGTPQYMSPEQAEMSAIDIDTRSDIYSLGVLLYELLTGTTPLEDKTLRSQAYDQIRRMIREVEPPRPSTRLSTMGNIATTVAKQRSTEAHKLGQMLRGELDWIVMRALEKDRTRRYDTATGMALDIQRHLDNEPVLARPPSTMYTLQKFVSRHWVGAMAGTAVLTALVIGLALASYGLVRARAEKVIAQQQKQLAVDNANRADGNARKADANAKQADINAEAAERNAHETEIRLAEGLVAQADALSITERFTEAHALYTEAYDKLVQLKQPLISAETGLSNLYDRASFPLMSFAGHTRGVWGVALSADGRTALSGGEDKTLKLWDTACGKVIRTLTGHTDTVICVAISPDGRTAVSGGMDKTLKMWDLASGNLIHTFTGHTGWVWGVAIAPDGRTALSGSWDHTAKLWDLSSGKELHTFVCPDNIWGVSIAPDGRTAILACYDKTLRLWELSTGKALRTFFGHKSAVYRVAISPDGRSALSGGADKTVKLWDLASAKEIRTFTGHRSPVMAIAFTPDGQTALSAGEDGIMKAWDVGSGRELSTFAGHKGWTSDVAISADGRTAISASGDKTINLWDLAGAIKPKGFLSHTDRVTSVAISSDGRTVLSGSNDKTLRLWDLASAREIRILKGHTKAVKSVAIAPDGRTGLSAADDGTLRLWDLASGSEIRTLCGHTDQVSSVAISPDGRTALSASKDKTVKLWDLASGKEIRTLTGHTDGVWCVAFVADGKTALSGSADKTLKLWDLSTGGKSAPYPDTAGLCSASQLRRMVEQRFQGVVTTR